MPRRACACQGQLSPNRAIIVYMSTLSVADARANFSRVVESASQTHERISVTRNGARVAVILGSDDFDALLETVEILADTEVMASIREGLDELKNGAMSSADDVQDEMNRRGRLRA